jgi:hypothetical protein
MDNNTMRSNIPVNRKIHGKFKSACALCGDTMIRIVETLIMEFVEDQELRNRVMKRISGK